MIILSVNNRIGHNDYSLNKEQMLTVTWIYKTKAGDMRQVL